jgi:hypothetical protein
VLYYNLRIQPSSVPIGYIGLQYATISAIPKDKQDGFEIQDWKRGKLFSFKAKDEQERNEWVNMLKSVKARAIQEAEASIRSTRSCMIFHF